MSYADMMASVEECEDLAQLIDFIEHCQEVCAQQKSLILKADQMHNQAVDGIKLAKRQIKKVLEKQNELGVRSEGLVHDEQDTAAGSTGGTAEASDGGTGEASPGDDPGRPDDSVSPEVDALDRW